MPLANTSWQQAEHTIRYNVHRDIRYQSCGMSRKQSLSDSTWENCVIRPKQLLNDLKHSLEPDMPWFSLDEKNFAKPKR